MASATPLQPLRVEQLVTHLRVFGIVAGVPTILLASFPDAARLSLAWGTQLVLLLGTVAMLGWRRHVRPGDASAVLVAGFVLNAVVIAGYVLAFSYLEPNVAWAMIFTMLADGALRFGIRGAVVGWVLSSLLFTLQAHAHATATGVPTPLVAYFFVLGTLLGAAGLVAIFTTALTQQVQVTRQQALALADANHVRERLLAMSSHEFRGSLSALVLAARTVRANLSRLSPERADVLLGDVDRHARNLDRLVDDLFAVARAQSQAVEVRRGWGDLRGSVHVALAAAERHRDRHELAVSVDPVQCELDHERVQQVVRNLVENAYKYSPAGSRVEVSAAHREGSLELVVADHGPGIPPADRERVFEPFRRRRGVSTDSDNAGLGLYVVKQLVAVMDGSLELRGSAGARSSWSGCPHASRRSPRWPPKSTSLNRGPRAKRSRTAWVADADGCALTARRTRE